MVNFVKKIGDFLKVHTKIFPTSDPNFYVITMIMHDHIYIIYIIATTQIRNDYAMVPSNHFSNIAITILDFSLCSMYAPFKVIT